MSAAGDPAQDVPRPDYGWAGRFGIGTPQANSTVEPEMRALMPDGVALYGLRLDSVADGLDARLRDFLTGLPAMLGRYGGLRLDGFGFACTGSSYMLEDAAVTEAVAAAEGAIGCPVVTATAAIEGLLARHGARRLAVLSPYPEPLHEAGLAFWRRRGFDIVAQGRVPTRGSAKGMAGRDHGIYGLTSADALAAIDGFDPGAAEAILLSGTGMPSAAIIDRAEARHGRPVVSSNLALARALLALPR